MNADDEANGRLDIARRWVIYAVRPQASSAASVPHDGGHPACGGIPSLSKHGAKRAGPFGRLTMESVPRPDEGAETRIYAFSARKDLEIENIKP